MVVQTHESATRATNLRCTTWIKADFEHRLNTIKNREKGIVENSLYSIARMRPTKRRCSLFAIYSLFPKLNVVGSIPVSRSKNQ